MYYSLNLKKKTVGRSIIFVFPHPPTPPSRLLKGGRDFRFGVFFKDANNIWILIKNFQKLNGSDSRYLWWWGVEWGQLKFTPRHSAKKPWRLWLYCSWWCTNIGLICLKINYLQFFPGDAALCTWSRKGSFTTARWLSIFSKHFCISL